MLCLRNLFIEMGLTECSRVVQMCMEVGVPYSNDPGSPGMIGGFIHE
jgi:hypothetical protein